MFADDRCVGVARPAFNADLVRLTAGSMQAQQIELPVGATTSVATCTEANALVVVGNAGAVVAVDPAGELAPTRLTCGQVRDIAGSHAGVAAVATASGEILVIDAEDGDGAVRTHRVIDSSEVHLSDDGSVLATAQSGSAFSYWPDKSARIVSLASGQEWQLIGSFPGDIQGVGTYSEDAVDLSRDGVPCRWSPFVAGARSPAPASCTPTVASSRRSPTESVGRHETGHRSTPTPRQSLARLLSGVTPSSRATPRASGRERAPSSVPL